jgi:hypothetical protein
MKVCIVEIFETLSVQVEAIPFIKIETCQLCEIFSISSQMDNQTLKLEIRIEISLCRNLQLD